MIKRLFDLLVCIILLPVVLALGLIVAILVLLFLGRPIMFSQPRPGLGGKSFRLYKFRTMRNDIDDEGNPLPDEARLTDFGRWLRSTSLDEIPVVYNVIKGDMSLVGPRPLLEEYLPLYSEEQARRHNVKPGITGWAVVNGRNALTWDQKFEYDVWYVDHRSFWLDIKIIWITLIKVITREGISHEGHATMEKFTGNENT